MRPFVRTNSAPCPRSWLFTAHRMTNASSSSNRGGEHNDSKLRGGIETSQRPFGQGRSYASWHGRRTKDGIKFASLRKKGKSTVYVGGVPIPLREEKVEPIEEQEPSPVIEYGIKKGERFFPFATSSLAPTLRKEDNGTARKENEDTRTHKRQGSNRDLPLPPLLQPAAKLKDRIKQQKLEETHKWTHMTRKEQKQNAPFSAQLQENPYALMLSQPMRQDTFTDARLPMSCLIDFYLCENPDEPKNPYTVPLSFAAELVSKTPPIRRKDEENSAVSAVMAETRSYQPLGGASYLINKQEAVDFITEDPKNRTPMFGVGSRTKRKVSREAVKWRDDMPDFVLQNMRKVLVKKLGFLVQEKGSRYYQGMVCAPASDDLSNLDSIEDAMCVVRLSKSTSEVPVENLDSEVSSHGLNDDASVLPDDSHVSPLFEEGEEEHITKNQASRIESMSPEDVAVSATMPEHGPTKETDPTSTVKYSQSVPFDSISQSSTLYSDSSSAPIIQDATPDTNASTTLNASHPGLPRTYVRRTGSWSSSERRSFQADLLPLPTAFTQPSRTYFPTMRYRNRRIPLYSLPELLGDELTAKLLKKTVFEDADWLVVTAHGGTVSAQTWLLKLKAYLAKPKEETDRI